MARQNPELVIVAFVPHLRISALGRFATSGETFSWGLSCKEQGWTFGDFAATQYWTDIADSVKDFHSSPQAKMPIHCVLEHVKFARIKADGSYGEPGVDYTESFTVEYQANGGDGSGFVYPPQDALCVSLNTSLHSPSGRGRVFLPRPVIDVIALDQYRIPLTDANALAQRFQTMINDINDSPGPDQTGSLRVCVASKKGFNNDVSSIRVGRVIDTMRSRRNKLDEAYTADFATG